MTDYDDEDEKTYSIFDRLTNQPRMCSRECDTCIFNAGSAVTRSLRPGRLLSMVNEARRQDSYIICHSTFDAEPAVCRGFAERYSTNFVRVMSRIGGGFREVDPPSKES